MFINYLYIVELIQEVLRGLSDLSDRRYREGNTREMFEIDSYTQFLYRLLIELKPLEAIESNEEREKYIRVLNSFPTSLPNWGWL